MDEFDEGEVTNCFGEDGCGDFDGDWDAVVEDARLVFVRVARY